jgi:hypothetical protein
LVDVARCRVREHITGAGLVRAAQSRLSRPLGPKRRLSRKKKTAAGLAAVSISVVPMLN